MRSDMQNSKPVPHKRPDCSVSLCSRLRQPLLGPIKKCPQYYEIVDSFKPLEVPQGPEAGVAGTNPALTRPEEAQAAAPCPFPPSCLPVPPLPTTFQGTAGSSPDTSWYFRESPGGRLASLFGNLRGMHSNLERKRERERRKGRKKERRKEEGKEKKE